MNVGLYSGAAGMRVGEDYQQLLSENLSMQSIPGYKQSFPVFGTDPSTVSSAPQQTNSGNPAAVRMSRMIDFSQGPLQPSGNPYDLAIQGQAFFQIREANGTTTYTRNGAFNISPQGQLRTSDGASVLGKSGSPVSLDLSKPGQVTIGTDGVISINGEAQGSVGTVHFDNPSASLHPGAFGRFVATNSADAKQGLAKNDLLLQGSLEENNGNAVMQMADMIQAARLYEANSKSMKAVDDTQNQLITSLGGRPQA